MNMSNNFISKRRVSTVWQYSFFILFIFFMAFLYMRISGSRYCNFDEFEVLYAAASLLRGKALFADHIEPHFPLFNVFIAHIIALFGCKATVIIIARYVMVGTNVIAFIFIYKIGTIIWNKSTGLLAVCLTLSSIVFFNKGIEIRHDVFNMTFNVLGAYYALRYIQQEKCRHSILSGIFLGIALASTQKAFVWNIGIIAGVSLYYLRARSYKIVCKINVLYFIMVVAPLIIILVYVMIRYNENAYMFFRYAIVDQLHFYAPHTKEIYPFPYNRYDLLKDLIFENHLLYALSIGGIFATIILYQRTNTNRIVVAAWALTGILFYVTAKRPFLQTFLPSIPPVSILAAGLISDICKDFRRLAITKKIGLGITTVLLLFIWPLCLLSNQILHHTKMTDQVDNVSFCLTNLKKDDKVLCFSQNQIFFDPVFRINWGMRGNPFFDYGVMFFEQEMIKEQCKVIINDYRTKLLPKEVKKVIEGNYLPIKTGDILIPGFRIGPRKFFHKKIWIEGTYYSPTPSLEVDGKKIDEKVIELKQETYTFFNPLTRPSVLFYIFDKERFLKHSATQ